MIEQAVALVHDRRITADDLMPASSHVASLSSGAGGRSLAVVVDEAERGAIHAALRDADGSRERAAEQLEISPTTLWRKMTRLGIVFDPRGA
jgi:two-component system response regulator HydG